MGNIPEPWQCTLASPPLHPGEECANLAAGSFLYLHVSQKALAEVHNETTNENMIEVFAHTIRSQEQLQLWYN
jgi:hypothetical protein